MYKRSKSMVSVSYDVLQIFKGKYLSTNCSFEPTFKANRTLGTPLASCLNFGYPENGSTYVGFGDFYSSGGGQFTTVQPDEEYYVVFEFPLNKKR